MICDRFQARNTNGFLEKIGDEDRGFHPHAKFPLQIGLCVSGCVSLNLHGLKKCNPSLKNLLKVSKITPSKHQMTFTLALFVDFEKVFNGWV